MGFHVLRIHHFELFATKAYHIFLIQHTQKASPIVGNNHLTDEYITQGDPEVSGCVGGQC